jgi:hypothetical protein
MGGRAAELQPVGGNKRPNTGQPLSRVSPALSLAPASAASSSPLVSSSSHLSDFSDSDADLDSHWSIDDSVLDPLDSDPESDSTLSLDQSEEAIQRSRIQADLDGIIQQWTHINMRSK